MHFWELCLMKNTLFLKKKWRKNPLFHCVFCDFSRFLRNRKKFTSTKFLGIFKGGPCKYMGRSWADHGRSWADHGQIMDDAGFWKNNFFKIKTIKTFYFIFWKKCFSYIRCAKRTWPDPGLSNKSGTVQPGPVTMLSNRPFVVPGFQGRSRDDFARPIPPLKSFILTIYLIVPQ